MTPASRQLLITLSNIGDAVMTTPVLLAMHALHPDTVVDIVADARSAELFGPCPFRGDILLKNKKEGWRGTCRLVRALRRHRYRLIVDLRTDGLSWLLRAQRRRTKLLARRHGGHAVERAWAVIAGLLHDSAPLPTRLWLSDSHRDFATRRTAVLPAGRLLAVAPGANWPPKAWPVSHFQALMQMLRDDVDAIVLLGGPGDRGACAELAAASALPVLDLAGKTSLLQAAAVIERVSLFVGNDSGLGHIAAAVGTATLTLFGPGDPARYRPWGPRAEWLAAEDGEIATLSPERVTDKARVMLRAPAAARASVTESEAHR
jgi:ADP-heptose:LPS heptosyltransferase